jgi:hypothetical protein
MWRRSIDPGDTYLGDLAVVLAEARVAGDILTTFVGTFRETPVDDVLGYSHDLDEDVCRAQDLTLKTQQAKNQTVALGRMLLGEPEATSEIAPWEPHEPNLLEKKGNLAEAAVITESAEHFMRNGEPATTHDIAWLSPTDKIALFDAAAEASKHYAIASRMTMTTALVAQFSALTRVQGKTSGHVSVFEELPSAASHQWNHHVQVMQDAMRVNNLDRYLDHADQLSTKVILHARELVTNAADIHLIYRRADIDEAVANIRIILETAVDTTIEAASTKSSDLETLSAGLVEARTEAHQGTLDYSNRLRTQHAGLLREWGVPTPDEARAKSRQDSDTSQAQSQLRNVPGFNRDRAAGFMRFAFQLSGVMRDTGPEEARDLLDLALAEEQYLEWVYKDVRTGLKVAGISTPSELSGGSTLRAMVKLGGNPQRWQRIEPILRRFAKQGSALKNEGILRAMPYVLSEDLTVLDLQPEDPGERLSPEEIRRRQLLRYEARRLYERSLGLESGFFHEDQDNPDRVEFEPRYLTRPRQKRFLISPERLAIIRALTDVYPLAVHSERVLDLGTARLPRFVIVVALDERNQLVPEQAAADDRVWAVAESPDLATSTLIHQGKSWRGAFRQRLREMSRYGTRRLYHTDENRFVHMGKILGTLVERDLPAEVAQEAERRLRANEDTFMSYA